MNQSQFPGGQLHIGYGLPQIEAVGSGSDEGNSERSLCQVSSKRTALG